MMQNTFLDNSLEFASSVESQFSSRLNLLSRGVKQAGFLVLYKTAMPGVLVETGFLSNPKEEKFLLSDKGQESIAFSIYRAFRDYKHMLEYGTRAPIDTSKMFAMKETKPEQEIKSVIPEVVKTDSTKSEVIFKVQFATSTAKKPLPLDGFKGVEDVSMYMHEGLCKYTVGNASTLEEASRIRAELMEKGYKDAFIVVFRDGKRITLKEAAQLLGN